MREERAMLSRQKVLVSGSNLATGKNETLYWSQKVLEVESDERLSTFNTNQ